jgi:3-oxoadipate enol-lactonase
MVLVHANPFDHRLFTYQIASLAPSFRLVAMDIRGYGRSDKPETPFTLNDMADDVLAVCAQEKITRAHLHGRQRRLRHVVADRGSTGRSCATR